MSLKKKIAGLFESFADLLEFKGENPFKINAFRNGAAVINGLEGSLEEMISDGSIKDVKGIGKGLLAIIHEYNEKGYSSEFEKLVAEVPAGIMDFLLIRGLGAKKIKNLYESLGVSSVEELESACKDNRVAALKGFGRKTQDMILGEIERIKSVQKLTLMDDAEKKVRLILTALSTFESVKKIEVSGEYRRACEIISKLEFVVLITDFDNFNKELVSNFAFEDVVVSDYQGNDWPTGKNSVMMKAFVIEQEFIVPVYFISTLTLKDYETLLFFSTGSPEFIKACGAENTQFDEESEPEIFNKLNSPYVIPEMREKEYYFLSDPLKKNSELERGKFHGFLHFHTIFSDGKNTLAEMAVAAREAGFEYMAVCDHSKAAFYANGMTEERVLQQKSEVAGINEKLLIPVFQGVESDILKDGELDFRDDFLKNFDFVVASVHSRFKMTEEEMTNRIIRAVENPNTDLLGHPTGRLLLARAPYQLNIKKVIDACAANKVAIEINASPNRLDLDWRVIYYAREKGCLFSINPDAHTKDSIDEINYGIRIARKGGIQPEEVINCMDLKSFKEFLNRKAGRNII